MPSKPLHIPDDLIRTSSFNIHGLDWDEPIYPLYAKRVATEIRIVVRLFREQLNRKTEASLLSMAGKIASAHQGKYPPLRKLRRGEHPLTAFRDGGPVFAALDPDPGRGDEGHVNIHSLERVVRLALLLHIAGYLQLTKKQVVDASRFAHRFRYADKHGERDPFGWASESYQEISGKFLGYIKQQDWTGLAAAANTYLCTVKKEDDSYYSSIAIFSVIAQALAARVWPKEPIGWTPTPLFPVGDTERERDGDVRTFVTIPDSDPRIPATNTKSQKALAVRGASMRLTCLWGDMSQEALHPIEARCCMRWLLARKAKNEAEEIALLLWILVGTTMHRFDNLLLGFGGEIPGATPNPELQITVNGTHITVALDVIQGINFDSVPEGSQFYFNKTGSRVSIQIDLNQCNLDPKCLLKLASARTERDTLIQNVLTAKDEIQSALRHEVCDVFTDNHFRGGLYQAIFTITRDIALLQLMTGELLGFSDAALHYATFTSSQIQSALNSGLERQYENLFTPAPIIENNLLIGAPTSAFRIEAIRSATTGLLMELQSTDDDSPTKERWIEEHNNLIDYIGWLLMLNFGSRNQADLPAMTLKQLSLTIGCAVLYEKGSDPSIFRRVAAVPAFTVGEIYRLIVHLRALAARFRKSNATLYQALRLQCQDILNGDQPFLQKLNACDNSELQFVPWNGKALVRELFPPGVANDICRHVMATRMRINHPAALVEAQLGHAIGYDLYDRSSIVEIPLLVKSLQGPLTDFLQDCGFPTETLYTPPPRLEYSSHQPKEWFTYHPSVEEIYNEDANRIRNMRASPTNQADKTDAQSALESVLCEFCDVESIEQLPKKRAVSKDECKGIYRNTLSRVSGGVKSLRAAATAVKVRLKQLKDTHQWSIDLPGQLFWEIRQPPDITHFHLLAYESLAALRIAVSKENRPAQQDLLMSFFGLHILIHGGAGSSWEEVYEVLCHASQASISPEMNALVVPVSSPTEESRSLSGLSMMALIGWRQCGRPVVAREQFLVGVTQILPRSWRGECPNAAGPLELLVRLGRAVEIPPIFAQVESQQIAARALKAHRLVEYLADAGNNTYINDHVLQNMPNEPIDLTNKVRDKRKYSKHLSILRDSIKKPLSLKILREAGYTPKNLKSDRSRASIQHYLNSERPPQLIQLLALWSQLLLGPHAHLKTGGPLKESTVLDYLNTMNRLLRPVLEHVSITNLEPEELLGLLVAQLSEDEETRDDESFLLNRLFREVSLVADIPRLIFPTKSRADHCSARNCIDADVVTPAETRFARACLDHWSRSPLIMASAIPPLRDAADLRQLSRQVGTRRGEIKYLRHKDYASYSDTTILKIRPSRQRHLKTKAARRRFILPSDQMPSVFKLPASAQKNDLIFSEISRPGLGFDPLQAVGSALKLATGDPASRLHRVRRAKVCEAFPSVLDQSQVIERIYESCKLTGSVGHSTMLSTVTSYTCTVYHLIGTRYTDQIQDYPYKYVESLAGTTMPFLAQTLYKYDNQRVLRNIAKRAGFAKPVVDYKKKDSRIPHRLLCQGTRHTDVVQFLYTLFVRKDFLLSLSPKISNATVQNILLAIDDVQNRTGIVVMTFDKTYTIYTFLSRRNSHLADAREQPRSQVSQQCFQSWEKKVTELSRPVLIEQLKRLQAYTFYEITRKDVYLRLSGQQGSPEDFMTVATTLGLPLRLIENTPDEIFTIELTHTVSNHIRIQSIKALIVGALVLAEISHSIGFDT